MLRSYMVKETPRTRRQLFVKIGPLLLESCSIGGRTPCECTFQHIHGTLEQTWQLRLVKSITRHVVCYGLTASQCSASGLIRVRSSG
jgi:hypothetical protein